VAVYQSVVSEPRRLAEGWGEAEEEAQL